MLRGNPREAKNNNNNTLSAKPFNVYHVADVTENIDLLQTPDLKLIMVEEKENNTSATTVFASTAQAEAKQ